MFSELRAYVHPTSFHMTLVCLLGPKVSGRSIENHVALDERQQHRRRWCRTVRQPHLANERVIQHRNSLNLLTVVDDGVDGYDGKNETKNSSKNVAFRL